MKIVLILLLVVTQQAYSSSCGDALIPFSFEVLPNGQPVLGCARPSCFGWSPNGQPLPSDANFSRIHQHADGFMRSEEASIPTFDLNDSRVYTSQQAVCEESFQSFSCASEDQWVGGIVPLLNVTNSLTAVQCCTYKPLRLASDRGIATVALGQIVVGGEIYDNKKQYAFDYISNVEKKVDKENKIVYEVNVRRLPCLSIHNIDTNSQNVIESVEAIRRFNEFTASKTVAHQAPIVQVTIDAEIPLQGVEVEEVAETVTIGNPDTAPRTVVKENIAQPRPVFQQIPQLPLGVQSRPFVQPLAQIIPSQQPLQFIPQQLDQIPYQPMAYSDVQTYYCFSGNTLVRTYGEKQLIKKMDELEVGDWVATIGETGIEFVSITHWMHRVPDLIAEFRKIELEDGSYLKLTDYHKIYRTECKNSEMIEASEVTNSTVYAIEVNVGDCLYKIQDNSIVMMKVLKISTVVEKGVYSPMTANGRILVNDIYASCNTLVSNHSILFSFFQHLKLFNDFFNEVIGKFHEKDTLLGMGTLVEIMDIILPNNIISS